MGFENRMTAIAPPTHPRWHGCHSGTLIDVFSFSGR